MKRIRTRLNQPIPKGAKLRQSSFSKIHILAFILVFGAIGGVILLSGKAATFTANLYVAASGGSPSCVRSTTLVDYNTALANNNVCGYGNGNVGYVASAWGNACKAAAAGNTVNGTIIGVKAGNYSSPSGGRLFEGDPHFPSTNFDCSGGLGAAVNPNSVEQGATTGTTAAWAHYQCADGDTAKNVTFDAGEQAFYWGSFHVSIEGGCFDFGTFRVGVGGYARPQRSSEVEVIGGPNCATDPKASDCIHMIGIDVWGGKDILVKNVNYGPSLQCAKNDPVVNPAYRCDPSVSFEAPFANLGTATAACGPADNVDCGGFWAVGEQPQTYIHAGDGGPYENVRIQNIYQHDANQVFASNLVHSGCTMTDNNISGVPPNNLVYDHLVCERFEIVGQQDGDSGVTIQNSVFGCATYQLDQAIPVGTWDSCATQQREMDIACRADQSPGCVLSDEIIRYNVFLGNNNSLLFRIPGGAFGTYSNVQVIGNIFAKPPANCDVVGITCDHNVFLNGVGTAGTNPSVLPAGDPFVDDNITTLNHSWQQYSTLNAHIKTGFTIPTVPNLGSAYDLATDGDSNIRSYPTLAGAYISNTVTPPATPPPSPPTTPTPPTSLKGDCDGDGHVTLIDLSILLKYYNQNYAKADFDGSGKVDLLDLSALLSRYGS